MKTESQKWWKATKNNPKKLEQWLVKQYRGEVTASDRIEKFAETYAKDPALKMVLDVIAKQERQHAEWVLELLKARGIEPDTTGAEERYWKETLPAIEDFETGAAVAAHAEKMRLARITAIAEDDEAEPDIVGTFRRILDDELFHERAFRAMAGEEAMNDTAGAHERSAALLGLTA